MRESESWRDTLAAVGLGFADDERSALFCFNPLQNFVQQLPVHRAPDE